MLPPEWSLFFFFFLTLTKGGIWGPLSLLSLLSLSSLLSPLSSLFLSINNSRRRTLGSQDGNKKKSYCGYRHSYTEQQSSLDFQEKSGVKGLQQKRLQIEQQRQQLHMTAAQHNINDPTKKNVSLTKQVCVFVCTVCWTLCHCAASTVATGADHIGINLDICCCCCCCH